jgi:PAS domain-containing protein
MARKKRPTTAPDSTTIQAELARKTPHPVAAMSRRGRILYANAAFSALVDVPSRNLRQLAATEVFPAPIVEGLTKMQEASQQWRDRHGRLQVLTPFKLRRGIGIAVHPAGPSTESGVWKALAMLDDLITGFPPAELAPALQAVRGALLPAQDGVPHAVKIGDLLSRLLTQRASRISELGLVVTPPQESTLRVPEDAATEMIGAVLDHCMAELRVRPLPRALRIAVATERDDGVTLKVTHNGVQQSHRRLAADAARWGVRFSPASPGPGLGVTYALTFTDAP